MNFLLNNDQRKYLGLDPIEQGWDIIELPGDTYRPCSYVVFDGNILKRHIITTDVEYKEHQYHDDTRDRAYLKPKTKRGKEKRLTASTLESRQPTGIYFSFGRHGAWIASHSTQKTFFSTEIMDLKITAANQIEDWLANFISDSDSTYLEELEFFKQKKRENIKIKDGDFFRFKIDRSSYGFGRVISNIYTLRKSENLPQEHGLNNIMTRPLLVKVYHCISEDPNPDLRELCQKSATPSQYIMDNRLFYGEYPIIGNQKLEDNDLDFPISYGRSIYGTSKVVFLQWGLIHRQLPLSKFNLYLRGFNDKFSPDNPNYHISNPYRNDSIGSQLNISKRVLEKCISNNSNSPFWQQEIFGMNFDLRNPKNKKTAFEILRKFKLKPEMSYSHNASLSSKKSTLSKLKDRLS